MMFIVHGYIYSISTSKLALRIDDVDRAKVHAHLNRINNTKKYPDVIQISSSKAKFNIQNMEWSDPEDLIGMHVRIRCCTRYYCFKSSNSIESCNSDDSIFRRGHTIHAIDIDNLER